MTTSAVTNPTTPVVDSAAAEARTKLSGDFQTFLLLLTTQLKNQDPIEPMDTNEFTAQLVQFANVEQAIDTNSNLETLIQLQQGSQINNAVSYIGKFVQAEGNSGRLIDGAGAFSYDLPALASSVEITITDARGVPVFTGNGTNTVGRNDVIWDGSNSFTGQDMPNGTYKIAVVAKDANGNKIEATPYTTGFVTAASLEGGDTTLQIGDIKLTLDKIIAVRDPTSFMQ